MNAFFKILSKTLCSLAILAMLFSCNGNSKKESGSMKVKVTNSLDIERPSALVALSSEQLKQTEASAEKLAVFDGTKEVPTQWVDGKLMFVVENMKAKEVRELKIKPATDGVEKSDFRKRTQAEISVKEGGHFENRKYIGGTFHNIEQLRVPEEHTDHSYYIRYEGPGWESDMVGYRFYLDWRNATDVFGKTNNNMVLQQVGQDGFDSYHELGSWGMDVLKVGKSLGVGTLATYFDDHANRVDSTDSVTCVIKQNGILYSAIQTDYYGWKVNNHTLDVSAQISIHAGTRLTKYDVALTGDEIELCTGLVKDDTAKLYTHQGNKGEWGYMATYGPQSLNKDRLGIAVFFASDEFKGFTEDEHSHIVRLQPTNKKLTYYFMAAWENEPNGIKDEEAFIAHVKNTAKYLATPVEVAIVE